MFIRSSSSRRCFTKSSRFRRNIIANNYVSTTQSSQSNDFAVKSEDNLPRESKVVICGGGIMGAAVAYNLAKLGMAADTVILEQGSVAGGSTFSSSGIIGAFKSTLTQVKLAQSSIEMIKELNEKGLETGWKQCGALDLARTRDRLTSFRRMKSASE